MKSIKNHGIVQKSPYDVISSYRIVLAYFFKDGNRNAVTVMSQQYV